MPVKIRLQRHGKKGKPYYHIVVADSRASRDGKNIERLGFYNPNTNPATIDINIDGAIQWLRNGAQPTDTARAILSYKGVLYKNHLLKGVTKGALTEEQANEKFEAWEKQKSGKIEDKRSGLVSGAEKDKQARLEAEKEVNKKRAEALAAANAPEVTEEEAPEAAETAEGAEGAEAPAAETETSTEASADETTQQPEAEKTEEDTSEAKKEA